jgi:hypothetical protein
VDGDRESSHVLMHLLGNCTDLEAVSAGKWEGQLAERTWADLMVKNVRPELAYFLPTPAEFEDAQRRLRLHLVEGERLNVTVVMALDRLADRTVLYPLVDVLEAYDGDATRHEEIQAALH